MGRLVGIVVASVAALALVACGSSTTTVVNNTTTVTAGATTTEGAAQTEAEAEAVMMNQLSQEFVEPAEFSFSVNGDLVANDLTWENWGADSATGSGSFAFRDYPSTRRVEVGGTVTVTGLSGCKGKSYYTKPTFSFDSKPPFDPQVALPTPCD